MVSLFLCFQKNLKLNMPIYLQVKQPFLCNSPLFHFPSLDTVDLTFYTPSQISVKYYIYIIQRCNRAHMSPKLPVSVVVQQEPQKMHQTLEKKHPINMPVKNPRNGWQTQKQTKTEPTTNKTQKHFQNKNK